MPTAIAMDFSANRRRRASELPRDDRKAATDG
jgi:hypothetical protein